MPVKIPSSLPAVEILKAENIFCHGRFTCFGTRHSAIEVTHIEPHAFKK